MNHLEISLLGPFRVTLDGEPVIRFRANSAQALLAYLAMHAGVAHRRETLAGLLWPDHPESVALQNLRQALRRLRTAIADDKTDSPPWLHATRTTIALHPPADPSTGPAYRLDVDTFSDAIATARGHAHRRLEDCAPCMQRLEEAVALYRGDLLQAFSSSSALFEEWMVVERERLHVQALEALSALAAYHEEREAYEQAMGYARRQVEMEGWRESAHRQWMRALALSGQRGAALAQYETCRQVLRKELGVEPAPETTALYERIRDGEELRLASPATPHNLPAQLTPFVGREALLAEIAARLRDPGCRLLTLVGPGGSGKTRLALEAAAHELDCYEHGVFFVALAPLQSPEAIAPAVAQALALQFHGEGTPEQLLLHYLRQRAMLLVLDNYEHLLFPSHGGKDKGGVALATDILRAAPGVKVLATSRAGLNVPGEHLLHVPGMAYPVGGPRRMRASTAPSSSFCSARRAPNRAPRGRQTTWRT